MPANGLDAAERDTPLPGARTALVLLLAMNLFNYIDRYVLAAVLDEIQKEFKATDEQVGRLATVFLISYMVAAPLFGVLAERYRRWALIGIGVLLWTVASGASGLATGLGIMLLTRVFVGIGEAAYGPAAPALISDMYPVKRRGSVLAWFYAAIPVGGALGYVLGGLVLKMGLSWHYAFFIVVPPGILLGLWALRMRDPPRGASDAGAPRAARWDDYLLLARTRSYVLCTLGMTAMTFAFGGIAFWMPTYVGKRLGGTTDDIATASAIFGGITVVAGLLATLSGGFLGDKLRDRYPGSYFLVSAVGMFIGFPLFVAMLYVPVEGNWIYLFWTLMFLAVFWLFFNTGPTNTILANVTHPAIRASAYAVNIFVIHALGDAISPWLIGWINDTYDKTMHLSFQVVSGMILLSGVLWLAGTPYLKRDTELAPTRLADHPPTV